MDCPSCGRKIGRTDAYCRYCGSATGAAGPVEAYASTEVAAPPVEEDNAPVRQPCQVCGAPTSDPSEMCENCAGVV